MDKVLIVDADPDFLKELKTNLDHLQQFDVLCANTGDEAMSLLSGNRIAVLVADVQAPNMDSLELLAFMTQKHPTIPCILMTDFGKPWFRKYTKQSFLYHLAKPFTTDALAAAIFVALNLSDEGLNYEGMALASLLPLIEINQKTCRLDVSTAEKGKGYLYFRDGDIIDARYNEINGEAAAREICTWTHIVIRFSELPAHHMHARIKSSLMEILDASWEMTDVVAANDSGTLSVAKKGAARAAETVSVSRKNFADLSSQILKAIQAANKEYLAIAILDPEGKILASDLADPTLDLTRLAPEMQQSFSSLRKTATGIDFDANPSLTLHISKGVILLHQFDRETDMTLYVMVLCSGHGNWYCMKARLENLLARFH